MTDRTWVGGSSNNNNNNNSVYAAGNWSAAGVPAPGDQLFLLQGTANMKGGDLSGDAITMGATNRLPPMTPTPASLTPVLNVSGGATVKVAVGGDFFTPTDNRSIINVAGPDNVDINSDTSTHAAGRSDFTVNITRGTMTGSVNLFNGNGVIDGPGKFKNVNSSLVIGSMIIKSDMIGTGSTSLTFMHLELDDRVSVGQTFTVNPASSLTIDHPGQFYGVVVATTTPGSGPLSEIDLGGIKADSYSMTNDLLTLYAGDKVVDSLVLHATPARTFVGQGSSGVVIELNGQSTGVSGLPLHTTSP
jgi:hypothetical protein